MAKPLSGFRAALLLGWAALGAAGLLYARSRSIPSWAALPALAAFLVEYPFYLVPAFRSARERVAGARLPVFLAASTALPYLAWKSVEFLAFGGRGGHPFEWMALAQLLAVALALGLWYFVLPPSPLSDLGFGALVTWIVLGRYFETIYPEPFDHVEVVYLGKIAVFQAAVLVLMLVRRVPETGYGFIPRWKDWRIGALNFLYFIPVGLPLALAIRAVRFGPPAPLWLIAGTFVAMLWVVTLAEEFLFRGVLQHLMTNWTGSRGAGLIVTAILFGLVHLPFRRMFPNWRWVLVAATLGWFCGRARNQAGDIRAAMVTHTLTVTAMRAFFILGPQ
jgi:membrane protease YdiL (CAAX protease family)